MVRIVDKTSRRNSILSATVHTYLNNAQPISSEILADDFGLSSATVRNVFAELEETGYLTHPHTSAGRVPTDKGYRYYVDFLMSEIQLLEEEKRTIIDEYKNKLGTLEDALEKTSQIIAQISHCTGIVSLLEWKDKLFYKGLSYVLEQPEFQNAQKIKMLVELLEEKKELLAILNRSFNEPVKIYIGSEIECPLIQDTCSLIVSNYNKKNRQKGKLVILGPRRMNYDSLIPALEFISEMLNKTLDQIE
ncbi:MAG: HTH domain-containing protein [Candidatus Omnitrophica bacterium]|nr:HTH domain-containing protein [Candidatus Omnitrophota bacterium]